MKIVCRAVQRIDNPDVVGFADRAAFFGLDRVIGIVFVNDVDHCPFGSKIGFADEIVATLLLDLQFVEFVQIADEGVSSAPCGHGGHVQHCVHVDSASLIKNRFRTRPESGGRIPDL